MAIITETFYINGREFTRTYSNANRYVVRDGVEYGVADDPTEFGRIYTEGNLIPKEDQPEAEAEEIIDILTGEIR